MIAKPAAKAAAKKSRATAKRAAAPPPLSIPIESGCSWLNQARFERVLELSPREHEVFCLRGEGLNTREITSKLKLSLKTTEAHLQTIREKLGWLSALQVTHLAASYNIWRALEGWERGPQVLERTWVRAEKAKL